MSLLAWFVDVDLLMWNIFISLILWSEYYSKCILDRLLRVTSEFQPTRLQVIQYLHFTILPKWYSLKCKLLTTLNPKWIMFVDHDLRSMARDVYDASLPWFKSNVSSSLFIMSFHFKVIQWLSGLQVIKISTCFHILSFHLKWSNGREGSRSRSMIKNDCGVLN